MTTCKLDMVTVGFFTGNHASAGQGGLFEIPVIDRHRHSPNRQCHVATKFIDKYPDRQQSTVDGYIAVVDWQGAWTPLRANLDGRDYLVTPGG